jgi:hypothetical protein
MMYGGVWDQTHTWSLHNMLREYIAFHQLPRTTKEASLTVSVVALFSLQALQDGDWWGFVLETNVLPGASWVMSKYSGGGLAQHFLSVSFASLVFNLVSIERTSSTLFLCDQTTLISELYSKTGSVM